MMTERPLIMSTMSSCGMCLGKSQFYCHQLLMKQSRCPVETKQMYQIPRIGRSVGSVLLEGEGGKIGSTAMGEWSDHNKRQILTSPILRLCHICSSWQVPIPKRRDIVSSFTWERNCPLPPPLLANPSLPIKTTCI